MKGEKERERKKGLFFRFLPRLAEIFLFGFLFSIFLFLSLFLSQKTFASTTTLYLGPLERTYDNEGKLKEENVYLPVGSATVLKKKQWQGGIWQEKVYFLHSDYLGSTVLITNEKGEKESSYLYYPYGQETKEPDSQKKTTDRLYTGQRKDNQTNLYYYYARYYNPKTGHFLSADKAEGPNRYSYVSNNPIMRNDPSGKRMENGDITDWLIKLFPEMESYIRQGMGSLKSLDRLDKNRLEKLIGNVGFTISDLFNDIKTANITCQKDRLCQNNVIKASLGFHALATGGELTRDYPFASKMMNYFLDQNNPGKYELKSEEFQSIVSDYFTNLESSNSYLSDAFRDRIKFDPPGIGKSINISLKNFSFFTAANSNDLRRAIYRYTLNFSGDVTILQIEKNKFSVSFNGMVNNFYDIYDWHDKIHEMDVYGMILQKTNTGKPFTIYSNPNQSFPFKTNFIINNN